MNKNFLEDMVTIPATAEKEAFNLWKILYRLQDMYKVNFWDFYDNDNDFDRWCNSKGYPQKDPVGKKRSESNIWFKEQQEDIKNGKWIEAKYCPFIDMFMYDIEDLGNTDMNDTVYTVNFSDMLERAKKEDYEEFGKDDYRVKLTNILLSEFGEKINVIQQE